MRLLPDGALDMAWKLFEEAFESLLLKVPMLWSAAVTSREILWEAPLAVSPALPSSTSCFRGHPEGLGGSWGTPVCLQTPPGHPGLRGKYAVKHSKTPKWLWMHPLVLPSGCYFQLPSLQVLLSSLPEQLSDLCCSAALHSCWKFWCLFKAWSRWTNGVLFFFP